MRRLAWVSAVAVGGALACSPTAPSPPVPPVPSEPHFAAGTVFSFASGEDGRPVAGASVFISGMGVAGAFERTFVTDAAGRIVLVAPLLHAPQPAMDVTAVGFLKRETLIRAPNETSFTLWPSTSPTGLDEMFTGTIVYSFARCPATLDPGHLRRHHPTTQEVTLLLGTDLHGDADIARHQHAVNALNTVLGNAPRYVVSVSEPVAGVVFTATVEPDRSSCVRGLAAAFINVRADEGSHITGGEIVYCSISHARSRRTIAHELGHSTGLFHSASETANDVMSCLNLEEQSTYSPREVLAMKLMHQRRGGNFWPDRDRLMFPSGPASTGPTSTTFVCPG